MIVFLIDAFLHYHELNEHLRILRGDLEAKGLIKPVKASLRRTSPYQRPKQQKTNKRRKSDQNELIPGTKQSRIEDDDKYEIPMAETRKDANGNMNGGPIRKESIKIFSNGVHFTQAMNTPEIMVQQTEVPETEALPEEEKIESPEDTNKILMDFGFDLSSFKTEEITLPEEPNLEPPAKENEEDAQTADAEGKQKNDIEAQYATVNKEKKNKKGEKDEKKRRPSLKDLPMLAMMKKKKKPLPEPSANEEGTAAPAKGENKKKQKAADKGEDKKKQNAPKGKKKKGLPPKLPDPGTPDPEADQDAPPLVSKKQEDAAKDQPVKKNKKPKKPSETSDQPTEKSEEPTEPLEEPKDEKSQRAVEPDQKNDVEIPKEKEDVEPPTDNAAPAAEDAIVSTEVKPEQEPSVDDQEIKPDKTTTISFKEETKPGKVVVTFPQVEDDDTDKKKDDSYTRVFINNKRIKSDAKVVMDSKDGEEGKEKKIEEANKGKDDKTGGDQKSDEKDKAKEEAKEDQEVPVGTPDNTQQPEADPKISDNSPELTNEVQLPLRKKGTNNENSKQIKKETPPKVSGSSKDVKSAKAPKQPLNEPMTPANSEESSDLPPPPPQRKDGKQPPVTEPQKNKKPMMPSPDDSSKQPDPPQKNGKDKKKPQSVPAKQAKGPVAEPPAPPKRNEAASEPVPKLSNRNGDAPQKKTDQAGKGTKANGLPPDIPRSNAKMSNANGEVPNVPQKADSSDKPKGKPPAEIPPQLPNKGVKQKKTGAKANGNVEPPPQLPQRKK